MYGQGEIRGNLELLQLMCILPFKYILLVVIATNACVRMYGIEGSGFVDI